MPEYFDGKLPTITSTLGATAILEAGRKSLDSNGQPYDILYENEDDINAEPCRAESCGVFLNCDRVSLSEYYAWNMQT